MIGLSTAVQLQEKFGSQVDVTIVTEVLSPNTTGDVSAGLWTPYLLSKTPMDKVMKWAKDSQDYFHKLWKTGLAAEAGVSLIPMIHLSKEQDDLVPEWKSITYGGHAMTKGHLQHYGRQYKGGFGFVSFICEPSKLLPFLQQQFLKNGGRLIMKKVEQLEEYADYDLIMNCAGLNSMYLVDDRKLIPVRGQVARVDASWQFHNILCEDHYIIPNMNCVILGGTHQENDFDLAFRENDKKFIFDGCTEIVPGLKNAPVIRNQVGLRPGRDEVRIELEHRHLSDGREMTVVHNYGHGGSGVTLCYGSAQEACAWAATALRLSEQLESKL